MFLFVFKNVYGNSMMYLKTEGQPVDNQVIKIF